MKITDLRTVAVRVPVERPTAIATRQLGAREYILVWIDTDDGHTGIGYTYAGTVGGQAVYDLVKDALRPLLIGKDPRLIEGHWAAMYQEVLLTGRRGAAMRAISAIDVALWDLLGKIAACRCIASWVAGLTVSRRMPPVGIIALATPSTTSARRCCRTRPRVSPTLR